MISLLLLLCRYIVLVLHRCYQKLWSGKRYTSAASQTEPEFIYKEGNTLCKTVLKPQPEQVKLPEIAKKQCNEEQLVKAKLLSNTKNLLHEDSSMQVDIPSQPKATQLSSPKSSLSPATASEKPVVGSNNTSQTCAENNQPNKVNGKGDRLQVDEDTPIKNSELCYTKSDIEDDIVLMKLKNESQVD